MNPIHEMDTDNAYLPLELVKAGSRWAIPHPIPYQGSKRNLASVLLSYFPEQVDRLVEPFAGSAALTLAAAFRQRAKRFVINDAHEPVISLWKEIVNRPEELAMDYERLWNQQLGNEREFFDLVRAKFNETHQPSYFLYLLARCVKAAVRYNASGEFNNSPDNRRKGAVPATMRDRITGAFELLKGRVEVLCYDYLVVLKQCDTKDLIYMDPPYQGVSGGRDSRYEPKIDHEEFCKALASLNERNCKFILSYDGRMGNKVYGKPLPKQLNLHHIEIHAGRSTQATLLGRDSETYESLYLSPSLVESNTSTCTFRDLIHAMPPG